MLDIAVKVADTVVAVYTAVAATVANAVVAAGGFGIAEIAAVAFATLSVVGVEICSVVLLVAPSKSFPVAVVVAAVAAGASKRSDWYVARRLVLAQHCLVCVGFFVVASIALDYLFLDCLLPHQWLNMILLRIEVERERSVLEE